MTDDDFDPKRRRLLKAGFGSALGNMVPGPAGALSKAASSALGAGATVPASPAVAEMMARNIADALGYGTKFSVTHTDRGLFREVGTSFWKLASSEVTPNRDSTGESKVYTAELENPLELFKLIKSTDLSATDSHFLHEAMIDGIQAHYQRVLGAQIKMMLLPDAHFNRAADYLRTHSEAKDLTEVQGLSGSVVDRKEMPRKIANTFLYMLELTDYVNENMYFRNTDLQYYRASNIPALLEGTARVIDNSALFSRPAASDVRIQEWAKAIKGLTFEDRVSIFFEELYAQHPDNTSGKRLGWFELPHLLSKFKKAPERDDSGDPIVPEIEGEKREELRKATLQVIRSAMEVYARKKPEKAASVESFLEKNYETPRDEQIVEVPPEPTIERQHGDEPHITSTFQMQQMANAASAMARSIPSSETSAPTGTATAEEIPEPLALEYLPGDPLDFDISVMQETVPAEPKTPDWN